MQQVRRRVVAISALSSLLPALAVLLVASPVASSLPPRAVGYLLLGVLLGWVLVRIATGFFALRLTPTENAVIRFWSFGPTFAIVLFVVLRVPTWLISAVAESAGWSTSAHAFLSIAVDLGVVGCVIAAICVLWRRHWIAIRPQV